MNINSIVSNLYNSQNTSATIHRTEEKSTATNQAVTIKTDSVEISSAAYELQGKKENMSASSGKDTLGISKGDGYNDYVIHFSDSAMVSRAISRGYITVNGVDIQLSDDVKNQLTAIDKQAQADRLTAFNQYIMEHEMAVAQQQGETLASAYKDMSEAIKIAAKISSGGKVSSSDMKKLMEINPQLYAMAMALRIMSEGQEKQNGTEMASEEKSAEDNDIVQGVNWSDFEWKSYDTQMTVSMNGSPAVENIKEGEISLS